MSGSCPVHETPVKGSDSSSLKVHSRAEIECCQTGSITGFFYCTRCGMTVDRWADTDDPANPPSVGDIVDINNPGVNPKTGDDW